MTIRNGNGNEYKILDQTGKFLLLENTTENSKGNKYVIAYSYDELSQAWQQGSYFDELTEAINYYKIVVESN
jgi:hypothetical protein